MGSIGAYGTNIPIAISKNNISSMVDISYAYHATRSFDSASKMEFKRLDPSILTPCARDSDQEDADKAMEAVLWFRALPIQVTSHIHTDMMMAHL